MVESFVRANNWNPALFFFVFAVPHHISHSLEAMIVHKLYLYASNSNSTHSREFVVFNKSKKERRKTKGQNGIYMFQRKRNNCVNRV